LERSKASDLIAAERRRRQHLARLGPTLSPTIDARTQGQELHAPQEFRLDAAHLKSKRIIAHNHADAQSTAFDMLRTQVLQSMDLKNWKFLGVTSPTPGCGKTVTAVNLALSIARQPERSVLLVDLDLRKPQVATSLGLKPNQGVTSLLEGRSTLADTINQVRIGDHVMMVLPTESSTPRSSDRMASRAMSEILQQIKKDYRSEIVVFDLPPILSSDDVLAILPLLDCVLLVAAVGTSTVAEIAESNKHLQSAEIVRVVLNKAPPSNSQYYYS
jgi:protein-tyrosine kinase